MANKMKNQKKDYNDQTAHNVACQTGCGKDYAKFVIEWIVNEIRAALVDVHNEAHVALWFKEGEMVKAMNFPKDMKEGESKELYDLAKVMAACATNPDMGYDELLALVTEKDAAGKEVSFKWWVAKAAVHFIKNKVVLPAKAEAGNETWAEFVQSNGNGAQAPVAYTWVYYWVPTQWMQMAYLMPVSTAPPAKAVAASMGVGIKVPPPKGAVPCVAPPEKFLSAEAYWALYNNIVRAVISAPKVVPTYAQATKGKSSGGVAPSKHTSAAPFAAVRNNSSASVLEPQAPAAVASAAIAQTGPNLLSMEMLGRNWADEA